MHRRLQRSTDAYRKVGAEVDEGADGDGLTSDSCREDLANHHPRDGAEADLQREVDTDESFPQV